MNIPEILAPVGGVQQLTAAVRCGANAVYLGPKGFNARQNAENFDSLSLAEAVSYCHTRGVKVYVTVNTLVTDAEREALAETAAEVAASGADGVIIQDLSVMRLFADRCPTLRRFASTQTVVHNIDGAKQMEALGFHRIVLARELSLREIEAIVRAVNVETELFVHGAHCMSVSGGCYLSAMLGERSGNRGLCAQPCRLDFQSGARHFALSLKDMSYIDRLGDVAALGVTSLKIEGRMKRPEYVAAAVTACRQALAGEAYDADTLRSVFSRSGFTAGYLEGRRTLAMFGTRTKNDVAAAGDVLGSLAQLYRGERPAVPVQMQLTVQPDAPAALTASCPGSDGPIAVTVRGEIPQAALTRPTDAEAAQRSLGKTGGTPFYLDGLQAEIGAGLMLPASALNALRREALDALLAERSRMVPHPFLPAAQESIPPHTAPETPALYARFRKAEQMGDTTLFDKIILPLAEIEARPELISALGDKLIGELPSLAFPDHEPQVDAQAEQLYALGLRQAAADNIYAVALAKRIGFTVLGGWGLNITNTAALAEYEKLGLSAATLSFELGMNKIRALGGTLPRGILGYGSLPLMRMRCCPAQGLSGCAHCDGLPHLTDRLGIDFPLVCEGKRYTTLLNSLPLYLADKPVAGVDFVTLYFTIEDAARCDEIARAYAERRPPDFKRTNGLYFRELK